MFIEEAYFGILKEGILNYSTMLVQSDWSGIKKHLPPTFKVLKHEGIEYVVDPKDPRNAVMKYDVENEELTSNIKKSDLQNVIRGRMTIGDAMKGERNGKR